MISWNIEPLIGLGPLKLGMSSVDVGKILDAMYPLERKFVQFDGSIRETRGIGLPYCTYEGDKLQEIEATHSVADVSFQRMDIFGSKSIEFLQVLEKANGGALYGVGTVLFYNLSISTSGFYDPKRGYYENFYDGQDERSISLTTEQAFKPLMSQFKRIKFLDVKK